MTTIRTALLVLAILLGIAAVAEAMCYTTTYIINGRVTTCTVCTDSYGNPISVMCF